MNLVMGNIMNDKDSRIALEKLDLMNLKTRENTSLPCERVIHACNVLSLTLNEHEHLHLLLELGMPEYKAVKELQMVKHMMSREYLETRGKLISYRLQTSLNPNLFKNILISKHSLSTFRTCNPFASVASNKVESIH